MPTTAKPRIKRQPPLIAPDEEARTRHSKYADPAGAKRQRSRGQVLVIFAGAIFLLMMMAAVVVDVSWYWVNSLRIQRAADAAALAGAVQLPNDPGTGIGLARQEATRNGYTQIPLQNTTKVTPKQDPLNPRRMDVTITADVGTFFMRVIGIPTIPATRTAKAEFTLPVPMGSPQNYYGVGILNLPTTHEEQQTTSVDRQTDENVPTGAPTGSSNNQWTVSSGNSTITQAVASDNNIYAQTNTDGRIQVWNNFNLLTTAAGQNNPPSSGNPIPIPNANQTVQIRGIEVLLGDAYVDGGSCSNTRIEVAVSKNNGGSYLTTSNARTGNLDDDPDDYTIGDDSDFDDFGGGTWTRDDLSNANFRLRLTADKNCSQSSRNIRVDQVRVRISYRFFTTTTIIVTDPPSPQPVRDPYNTVTLAPQGFWGAMQSQGAPSVQGDAYMTGYTTRTSATNPKYDPAKYYNYGIDMPSGGGEVWIFDPGFCETGIDGATHQNQGTGENWTVGGSNGNSSAQPVSAQYELFKDDANTPYEYPDDVWQASSGTTFRRLHLEDPTLGGNDGNASCASLTWHNKWWRLASNLPAGKYRLHTTSRIYTDHSNQSLDGTDNQLSTTALNAFAIWTKSTSGMPRVYGLGAMEAYFPLSGGKVSTFYLAQIEDVHAGKWMDIDLWDPGDTGELSANLRIMQPMNNNNPGLPGYNAGQPSYQAASFYYNSLAGTTIPANFTCGPGTPGGSGPTTSVTTNTGGSSLFNGRWLRICIRLDDNYIAPTPKGETEPGWWKIQYSMGGTSSDDPATDLTTWQVTIRGNPVHLVIP